MTEAPKGASFFVTNLLLTHKNAKKRIQKIVLKSCCFSVKSSNNSYSNVQKLELPLRIN